MRRVFKNYGRFNGKCTELTSLRDVAGLVHLEPFEETFEFREQTEKVIVRAAIGKAGGGISNEEILTAKQKLVFFLQAAAQNKKDSDDLQEIVRSQTKIIPFAETSPALFVDPKTILLRKP